MIHLVPKKQALSGFYSGTQHRNDKWSEEWYGLDVVFIGVKKAFSSHGMSTFQYIQQDLEM